MKMRHFLCLIVGITTLAVQGWSSDCPHDGSDLQFTIDTVGVAPNYDTAITCNEDEPADCGLVGVLTYLNEVFPTQCQQELKDGLFSNATFSIRFADDLDEMAGPTQESTLLLPAGLGHLNIDGTIANEDVKFTFRDGPDSTGAGLQILCQGSCNEGEMMPDLTVRNIRIANALHGLKILGASAARSGAVTLENLTLNTISEGAGLILAFLYENDLNINNITISGPGDYGISLMASTLEGGHFTNISANGVSKALDMTLVTTNLNGHRLTIRDFVADNVDVGINLVTSQLTGMSILKPDIRFRDIGINYHQTTFGNNDDVAGVIVSDALLQGIVTTNTQGFAGIIVQEDRTHGRSAIQVETSDEGTSRIGGVYQGIIAKGFVNRLKIDGVDFNNVSGVGVLAVPGSSGREPRDISVDNITSDAQQTIALSSASPNVYADGIANNSKTNRGVDTPPFLGIHTIVQRDWDNPTDIEVTMRHLEGVAPALHLEQTNGSYRQIELDESSVVSNCAPELNGVCRYIVTLDLANYGISADAMNDTHIQVGAVDKNSSSVLSDPISLADATFIGTKILQVDTNVDDQTANTCLLEEANDCSLRGALFHALSLRAQGEHHPVLIRLAAAQPRYFLNAPLDIGTHSITIDGRDTATLIAAGSLLEQGLVESFIRIGHNHTTLKRLHIEAQSAANVVIDTDAVITPIPTNPDTTYNVSLRDLTIRGVASSRVAILAPKSLNELDIRAVHMENVTLRDMPVTSTLSQLSFEEGSSIRLAYVKNLAVTGPTLPANLLPGLTQITPSIVGAITPHWENFTFDIIGQAQHPYLPQTVDVYVSFSDHPTLRLGYIGSYTTESIGDDGMFTLTAQLPDTYTAPEVLPQLATWGTMTFHIIGQSAAGDTPLSMGSTPGVTLNEALSDLDSDGDGHIFLQDNCPQHSNPDQTNTDGDLQGDACDDDDDGDGSLDVVDNCPLTPSANHTDTDFDGDGDVCDDDDDNDGIPDAEDNCPFNSNADQETFFIENETCIADSDKDGTADTVDTCPEDYNPEQLDLDGDGFGNVCDGDDDGDDTNDVADNCPVLFNVDQLDLDGDAIGDACDDDIDGDQVPNAQDNCPLVSNAHQGDSNSNGIGDVCDELMITIPGDGNGETIVPSTGEGPNNNDALDGDGEDIVEPPLPEGPAASGGGGCGCQIAAAHKKARMLYRKEPAAQRVTWAP